MKATTYKTNNWRSAIVVFNNGTEERRTSLCSISAAMEYVKDVVLANNWQFIAVEGGLNY